MAEKTAKDTTTRTGNQSTPSRGQDYIFDPATGRDIPVEKGILKSGTEAQTDVNQADTVSTPPPELEKPDFRPPTQSEEERLQSLRAGAAEPDPALLASLEETEGPGAIQRFRQSQEDARAKIKLAEDISRAERTWRDAGQTPPADVQEQFARAKSLVYGGAAPYVDLSKGTIDLQQAITAGAPDAELRRAGVTQIAIVRARRDIRTQERQRGITGEVLKIREDDRKRATEAVAQVSDDARRQATFQASLSAYIDQDTKVLRTSEAVRAGMPLSAIRAAGYDLSQADYNRIKRTLVDEKIQQQALSSLSAYQTTTEDGEVAYRLSDYLADRFDESRPYTGSNRAGLDKAVRTLQDAGFSEESISASRVAAFASPAGGLEQATGQEKVIGWSERTVLNLEQWNTDLKSDLEESMQDKQTYATKLLTSVGGGLLQAGATLATAPMVLAGRILSNPAGAPATVWDVGTGMVQHVLTTGANALSGRYVDAVIRRGDASSLVYDTTMSYLILHGAGRATKGVVNRVTTYVHPRGLPSSAFVGEISTGRLAVSSDQFAKNFADAMNKVEVLAARKGGKLTGSVPIKGTPYSINYVKTAFQQKVGDVLFHGTKTEVGKGGVLAKESLLRIAEKQGGKIEAGKAGLYTDPWAAIGYTRGGESPGILMIVTDAAKIKSGSGGLAKGLTQSDQFIRSSKKGFYGSSKTWRGELETEVVAAPGTALQAPKPTASLLTRLLAGRYSDFFTYDTGKFVPVKIALDVGNLNPAVVQALRSPASLYGVKLYSLYSSLRATAKALRHPDLVLKDVSGIAKELANLDRYIRDGTGAGGGGRFPGLRDVYLTESLGARLQGIITTLVDKALRRTKQQLGSSVREDSAAFRTAFERNLEVSYRATANSIINSFRDISRAYAVSLTARSKFEAAYLSSLSLSTEALAKSADVATTVREVASGDSSKRRITEPVRRSVSQYTDLARRESGIDSVLELAMSSLTEPSTASASIGTRETTTSLLERRPVSRDEKLRTSDIRTPATTGVTRIETVSTETLTAPVRTPPSRVTTTERIPETEVPVTTRVPEETITTRVTPPSTPTPVVPTTDSDRGRPKVPAGSIAFAFGQMKRGRVLPPVWKVIAPDDFTSGTKPKTYYAAPLGARNTDSVNPYDTIQVIGRDRTGVRVPKSLSIDLGVTDAVITNYGTTIRFTGRGQETDVGERIPLNTQGLSVRGGRTTVTRRRKPKRKGRRQVTEWDELTTLRGFRF